MNKKVKGSGALYYSLATNRFLLLHRTKESKGKPRSWGVVGGTLEGDETPWEGLQREITEEVGKFHKPIKIIPFETFISNDDLFHFYTYLCVVKEEFMPTLNSEHDGYAWCALGQWPKPLHHGLANTLRSKTNQLKLETALRLIKTFVDPD